MGERVLLDIARNAGDLLSGFYGRIGAADADRKGDLSRDLVSRADIEAERLILDSIPASDRVLSEESGERPGSGRWWIVDPLDGTINFLHQIPFWCVSIAVVEDGDLVEGVIHAPQLGLTFVGRAGDGVLLNGELVTVSGTRELGDAILATGFPYARDTLADNNLDNVPRLGIAVGGLRRMGSAALDLAFTAAGRLDGYWELHLSAWDVAAGILLVREAGGTVTDFRGESELQKLLFGRNIVASNGHLHTQIAERLEELREL
ncbi:MAG: inositol monophosphatase [Acidobacteria bacterium]|nr:inositol monophosphatase [Acidobacteriota bacterium]